VKTFSKELLNEIVRRLADALHPEEIYLFGSQASGVTDANSDVDILVVVPETDVSHRALARRGRKSLRGMGVPIDLVVCTVAEKEKWAGVPCNLIHTAAQEGRQVYAAGD